MAHILITGGAGFIGSHLVEKYLQAGDLVTVIDNLSTGRDANLSHLINSRQYSSHLRVVINSILNRPILERLISAVDCVVHLAAAVGVKYVLENPLLTIETNVKGTDLILELCAKHNKRVLIASSSEVYGKQSPGLLCEDDDCLIGASSKSRWNYASTKLANEHSALSYFSECDLKVTVVRLFNTSGARQRGSYGMVIPRLVKQALANQPLTVFGDGLQTRTFTDVSEVVQAIFLLTNSDNSIGEIVNICGVDQITIGYLAEKIVTLCNSKSEINFIPYSQVYGSDFEDIQCRSGSTAKLQSLVGFAPNASLATIIQSVINHYRESLRTADNRLLVNF